MTIPGNGDPSANKNQAYQIQLAASPYELPLVVSVDGKRHPLSPYHDVRNQLIGGGVLSLHDRSNLYGKVIDDAAYHGRLVPALFQADALTSAGIDDPVSKLVQIHASAYSDQFTPDQFAYVLGDLARPATGSALLADRLRVGPEKHDATLQTIALQLAGVYDVEGESVRIDRQELSGGENTAKMLLCLLLMRDPMMAHNATNMLDQALQDRASQPAWHLSDPGSYQTELAEAHKTFIGDAAQFRRITLALGLRSPQEGENAVEALHVSRDKFTEQTMRREHGILAALGATIPYEGDLWKLYVQSGVRIPWFEERIGRTPVDANG